MRIVMGECLALGNVNLEFRTMKPSARASTEALARHLLEVEHGRPELRRSLGEASWNNQIHVMDSHRSSVLRPTPLQSFDSPSD